MFARCVGPRFLIGMGQHNIPEEIDPDHTIAKACDGKCSNKWPEAIFAIFLGPDRTKGGREGSVHTLRWVRPVGACEL